MTGGQVCPVDLSIRLRRESWKVITAVKGFTTLGKCVGIKRGRKDFAVIYSDRPCSAVAMYTRNKVKGAPLIVNRRHLRDGRAQVIVVNSGVANVATGSQGIRDAITVCELASKEFGVKARDVLVASTGVIGRRLPMKLMRDGISGARSQLSKRGRAAEAIMTTDLVKKEISVKAGFTIGAIAKGSGMIHPNMATMLAFIATDADLGVRDLRSCLKEAVDDSFNMISVDMDTSTSDMVVLMSNRTVKAGRKKFREKLSQVCRALAMMIASDGEGATKLIEVEVRNAGTRRDARGIAKAIVSSNLVKCAMFGNDPNWGRVMSAIGNSGADFRQDRVDISFQGRPIARNGVAVNFDARAVSKSLKSDKVKVVIDLKNGRHRAVAYGCDMSYGYVEINAEYHT